MRLSRHANDPELFFYADRGKALFLTDRGDYWQCGVPAPKAAIAEMQAKGIEAFRAAIVELAPFFEDRVEELRDWNDLKLLSVSVDRLPQWHRPGLVCIGDAAHAMSPVGGVGTILPFRTPSRRPIYWQDPLAKALSAPTILPKSSAAVPSPPGSRRACRR
jgi:2-polyprenyl-6-methoxyphenol hydroxylase-like FAD-dependent oxidoreductase